MLRIVSRADEAQEFDTASPPETARPSYMERALQARIEDLPHLLHTLQARAATRSGDEDLSEAILHLSAVSRALIPERPSPAPIPLRRGVSRMALVGGAGLAVSAAALLLWARTPEQPRLAAPTAGPALATSTPAPTPAPPPRVAAAMQAAAPITRTVGLSRGESVAANARHMLAKFPLEAPVSSANDACAESRALMASSRALARRIADPLLAPDASGRAAPELDASNWDSIVFISRLLRNAERAQQRARTAGCALE